LDYYDGKLEHFSNSYGNMKSVTMHIRQKLIYAESETRCVTKLTVAKKKISFILEPNRTISVAVGSDKKL
jgi:hypothetical protein